MATEDDLERRRDELRRIVYGAPGEPPAAVAAELAAVERELAARQCLSIDAVEAVDRVDAVDDAEKPAASPQPPRRLSRGWSFLVAAAAILLVAVGLAVLAPVREALSPPRGLEVFDRPPTAEERDRAREVVVGAHLEARGAVVLRSLGHVVGYEFWAMLDGDQVCLLSRREFFFDWFATCTSRERFDTYGLTRWISVDDIRHGARPSRALPDDIVVASWGPRSSEVEWRVAPGS
ncbi:hypothetical protein [Agromyces albus]|uniref:Uncharacterized protein n=1 Tax=Agromyces albus TaxID=205332 RepID=A0A4V1QYB8_9MICO|nr:hypothetical protein [Agromyces albus]RXZ72606.1 hypothetical protein ESP51_03875 [Agromyces albus]